jgi:fermentation-respiration switch protein FrsA (DUF1100 family)
MTQDDSAAYAVLDRSEVLRAIFHPRAESAHVSSQTTGEEHLIEVATDTCIGARFHMCDRLGANILFFHGNGEIAADYDDLAPMYTSLGINFLVVDYRGYGRSSGYPTVSAMMSDCHALFDYTQKWLQDNDYSGPLVVMGRSLGSASALDLVIDPKKKIDGLIIESGFAFAGPLLRLLGVDTDRIGFNENKGFRNVDKIQRFSGPTLVIHAEYDHIIPFSDGKALHESSKAPQKQLLKIKDANHNDIFFRGMHVYMRAIRDFIQSIAESK